VAEAEAEAELGLKVLVVLVVAERPLNLVVLRVLLIQAGVVAVLVVFQLTMAGQAAQVL
jgi:hypothetical protein